MNKILKRIRRIYDKFQISILKHNEIKKFKDKRRKKIYKSVVLTKDQKQIDVYFKKYYGKKIPYTWHRHYTAFTGNFDYRYMPELLPYTSARKEYFKKVLSKGNGR